MERASDSDSGEEARDGWIVGEEVEIGIGEEERQRDWRGSEIEIGWGGRKRDAGCCRWCGENDRSVSDGGRMWQMVVVVGM